MTVFPYFVMGRDPVELSKRVKYKPPAMRVCGICYTPYNSRVLKAFGGGGIHYCGTGTQHIESFLVTEGYGSLYLPDKRNSLFRPNY